MTSMKRRLIPVLVFGVIVAVVGLGAIVGRYASSRRTARLQEQNERYEALAAKLPDMETLRRVRISYKDRVQPLDSVARSALRTLAGTRSLFKQDPVLVFLSLVFDEPESLKDLPLIVVQHGVNKERLGMAPADGLATWKQAASSKAFNDAVATLREEGRTSLTSVEQETFAIFSHSREIENQFEHLVRVVPPWPGQEADPQRALDWHLPVMKDMVGHDRESARKIEAAWLDIGDRWRARDMDGVNRAAETLTTVCKSLAGRHWVSDDKVERELRFNGMNPMTMASYFYFAAAILGLFAMTFGLKWMRWFAFSLALAGIALNGYGFVERIVLGFGVAITNLYESMVAMALLGMPVALIFDLRKRSSWNLVAAGLCAFIILQFVDIKAEKYDAGIGGTVAVLANNFWVHIHVPIIMTSYAAFFIAWLLSVVGIIWFFLTDPRTPDPEFKSLKHSADVAVNLGTVFVFAGLILGGVWAHDSWGRFWGWDPKEVWAAILFLWYLAAIHGRYTGWMNSFSSLLWYFAGGGVMLFAYYGTNELLSGLHSYASSAGSGGFMDNLVHKKNNWFVWTMVGIILASVAMLVFYRVGGYGKRMPKAMPEGHDADGAERIETAPEQA